MSKMLAHFLQLIVNKTYNSWAKYEAKKEFMKRKIGGKSKVDWFLVNTFSLEYSLWYYFMHTRSYLFITISNISYIHFLTIWFLWFCFVMLSSYFVLYCSTCVYCSICVCCGLYCLFYCSDCIPIGLSFCMTLSYD